MRKSYGSRTEVVRLVALAVFVFCTTLLLISRWVEAAPPGCEKQPPCDPAQQREDIFPWAAPNMQLSNPVTVQAKASHVTSYRLLTMPGCSTGTVPADMARVEVEAQKVKFTLFRDDTNYNFTVRINCGSEQIRYCGSVTVFCLGRGFPYNPDVEISDIISTYYPDSRLGILLHEIMGHAVGTWNEQYALCGSSCGFASTPGLRDVMNTGPDSRHGLEQGEINRWIRTMYPLVEAQPYESCTTYPGWEPSVSCYWPALGKWLWGIEAASHLQVWEWSTDKPRWSCSTGCPQ